MYRPVYLAAVVLVAGTALLRGEEPVLRNGDLPGLAVTGTAAYEGKALYGYINGGADLYREYGFVRLTVQELTLDRGEYTVEIYRMTDDSAAYGIYCIAGPSEEGPLGPYSAVTPYQARFAAGPCFVRVVTGNPVTGTRTAEIAQAIRRRIPEAPLLLPGPLKNLPPGSGPVRYVRGPLGIQNAAVEWSDLFEGLEPFSGYLVTSENDSVRIAWIRFGSTQGAEEFLRRISGRPDHGHRRLSPVEVFSIDGPGALRERLTGWR
jgi:hypothetical protein